VLRSFDAYLLAVSIKLYQLGPVCRNGAGSEGHQLIFLAHKQLLAREFAAASQLWRTAPPFNTLICPTVAFWA
jgi:hypothetical protein